MLNWQRRHFTFSRLSINQIGDIFSHPYKLSHSTILFKFIVDYAFRVHTKTSKFDDILSSEAEAFITDTFKKINHNVRNEYVEEILGELADAVREYASDYFYASCYIKPHDLNKMNDMHRHLMQKTKPRHSNIPCIVTGDIGSGKSTFLTYYRYNFKHIFAKHKIIPIYVDLDALLRRDFDSDIRSIPNPNNKGEILRPIYETILKTYNNQLNLYPESMMEELLKKDFHVKTSICESHLTSLYDKLYHDSNGIQPILFIDNLDFLYHHYDRIALAREFCDILEKEGKKKEVGKIQKVYQARDRAFKHLDYLIKAFTDNESGEPSLYQLGMSVVIAMRGDSYNYYKSVYSDKKEPSQCLVYEVNPISSKNCIEAHGKLLKHLSMFLDLYTPDKTNYFSEMAELIIGKLKGNKTTSKESSNYFYFEHDDDDDVTDDFRNRLRNRINSLSKRGLRQLVQHYANIVTFSALVENANVSTVTRRLTRVFHPGILSFILNMKVRYSQVTAEFPNVYLVRSESAPEIVEGAEFLFSRHPHSYWLKRLILEAMAQEETQSMSLEDVLDIFCGDMSQFNSTLKQIPGYYDPRIVLLLLGGLSQIDKCYVVNNLYRFSGNAKKAPQYIERIQLNNRGKTLLLPDYEDPDNNSRSGNKFIDSFTYLQLVVEDIHLPIPKSLSKIFTRDPNLDYRYFIYSREDYLKGILKMLTLKIPQVFWFIEILKISLEFEKKRFKHAFEQFESYGNSLPDLNEISCNIRSELESLFIHLSEMDLNTDFLQNYTLENHSNFGEISKQLRDELSKVYSCNK